MMDLLQGVGHQGPLLPHFLDLLDILKWPVVVVIVILVFRKSLRILIRKSRIKKVSLG